MYSHLVRNSLGATSIAACLLIGTTAFAFIDLDRDRMDDDWELANGLDPTNKKDGRLDPDFDRLKNKDWS